MPSLWLLGRAALWLPGRELAVGRLAVAPVRPCVPTVGRVEVLGLAVVVALAEPVLPEVAPLMLPVVGRLVVAVAVPLIVPLIEPLAVRLPTVAPFEVLPPSLGRR